MIQLSPGQFAKVGGEVFRERLRKSLARADTEFGTLPEPDQKEFIELSHEHARGLGFRTEQGVAAYALGALWMGIGFEEPVTLLMVLLRARIPEAARAKAVAANPNLPQEEYQSARESMLGKDFATTPDGAPCIPCMANAKAARRAERLKLVNQSINGCPEHADVAARLRGDMDQVENARVAKAVYLKYDPDAPADLKVPPPGFLDPSDDELAGLGLNKDDLAPKGTDFRAAVYKKDPIVWGDDPKPPYDVVFRGSTLAPEDWQNNFAQNANNESIYYKKATLIGNSIANANAVDQVQLVGHSLGGGLASAAQGGSGAIATTFNAAGLNPKTVVRYSTIADRASAEPDKILAYHVDGEVVTKTQESGLTQYFSHPAPGMREITPTTSAALTPEDRHSMDEVIGSIEKQKTADETTLKDCLASK